MQVEKQSRKEAGCGRVSSVSGGGRDGLGWRLIEFTMALNRREWCFDL